MAGNRPNIRRCNRLPRGLSLLELMLALSISVIVLGLMSMAIRFQMHTFEKRRDRIEEAQLARAILRSIADDLRSAVAHRPIDLQGVNAVTGNATQAATGLTDGGDPSSGDPGSNSSDGSNQNGNDNSAQGGASGANSAGSGSSGSASSSGSATGTTEEMATSTGTATVAGLYGDQSSLTFDIARLPRLDEYQAIVAENVQEAITQIPADVRTVSYYLQGSAPMTGAMSQAQMSGMVQPLTSTDPTRSNPLAPPEGRGLVRQERDRSVASYSEVAVDLSDTTQDTGEDLLADEVTRLEFRYFDGYQWWPDWDSDVRGGLPMAVEILIGMADRKTDENSAPASSLALANSSDTPQELLYRLVVRIPTAEPLDSTETGAAEEGAAAADAAGSSTTSSSMSGGS